MKIIFFALVCIVILLLFPVLSQAGGYESLKPGDPGWDPAWSPESWEGPELQKSIPSDWEGKKKYSLVKTVKENLSEPFTQTETVMLLFGIGCLMLATYEIVTKTPVFFPFNLLHLYFYAYEDPTPENLIFAVGTHIMMGVILIGLVLFMPASI